MTSRGWSLFPPSLLAPLLLAATAAASLVFAFVLAAAAAGPLVILVLVRAAIGAVVKFKAHGALMPEFRVVRASGRTLKSATTATGLEVKAEALTSTIHVPLILVLYSALP